ncbi:MAG TPA: hypothetical protein VFB72_07325 [Verrucomicrobiae bacterium]|nr:hypothetical protein [Verrucomicrobiae bacterium]
MHVMLADSIDGGIFAILVLFCGFAASLLALIALVPAARGNKPATFVLVLPALLVGLAITYWLGAMYIKDGLHQTGSEFRDMLMTWIVLSGAPFGTTLLSILVLWYKRRKLAQRVSEQPSS